MKGSIWCLINWNGFFCSSQQTNSWGLPPCNTEGHVDRWLKNQFFSGILVIRKSLKLAYYFTCGELKFRKESSRVLHYGRGKTLLKRRFSPVFSLQQLWTCFLGNSISTLSYLVDRKKEKVPLDSLVLYTSSPSYSNSNKPNWLDWMCFFPNFFVKFLQRGLERKFSMFLRDSCKVTL